MIFFDRASPNRRDAADLSLAISLAEIRMTISIGKVQLDIWHIVSVGIGGGLVLTVRILWQAIATDVAKRITASLWGMRTIDSMTPAFLHHSIWSGTWDVTWEVESPNFELVNTHRARLYRCFNTIALEGLGTTTSGNQIPYGFTGKLSRDKSIATGIWFDRRWGDGGYHGVYQVRISGTGDCAIGLWCGFSETSPAIKSDKLVWTRVNDA